MGLVNMIGRMGAALRAAAVGAALAGALAAPAAAKIWMGDDGLHKADWQRDTFKDLREDLEAAREEGKILMLIIEQRGCIYCKKMYEEIFTIPEIENYIRDHFFVVQINMFGDVEVTDFDGTTLPEKEMVKRWNILFTPTMMFFPPEVPEGVTADRAAIAVMPGAFGKYTTYNLFNWIVRGGWKTDEPFQMYHRRAVNRQLKEGRIAIEPMPEPGKAE